MWIDLDGLVNLRDLGGTPTTDGATIATRRLLRSDNLQSLTPSAIDHLLEIGLSDVIDLRSTYEVVSEGPGPLTDRPEAYVHLVERNAKKAAFLREALRVTGARGTVHLADIENFVDSNPPAADYITARALAPLNVLLSLTAPLIGRGATALFLKGQDVEVELTQATKYWTVRSKLHPSRTSMDSRVVEIDQISAKGAPATERRDERS